MNINERGPFAAALLAIGLGASFVCVPAAAHAEAIHEIVVYGTPPGPPAPVLDIASMRVDVKQQARAIGRSVRRALGEKSAETQVATATGRTRG